MKRTWWDRWENEMHFEPVADTSGTVPGAIALFVVLAIVAGLALADHFDTGAVLQAHTRPIAALILMTLISLAALASLDEKRSA